MHVLTEEARLDLQSSACCEENVQVLSECDDTSMDLVSRTMQAKFESVIKLSVFPITLKFEEVVYKIKLEKKRKCTWGEHYVAQEKTILNGLTGLVGPGEMMGMLGPSGSGKTTFLTALGGRHSGKLSGKITYNAHSFSGAIKRRIGFVAQEDVLYPHLTVFETLLFTALLRLPKTLNNDEKSQHAERVLSELCLNRCRNSMIGGTLFRGISGGEKKRVTIGQEMLINPSLLLLDEPTSGLDSTTAQRILTTIKKLASGGRTVITTIHQPSSRLYGMFDKVLLLSEGSAIYYGSSEYALDYFSSLGFSTSLTVNPADLLLDLANGITEQQESTEDEQKHVREALISAFSKNISTRMKSDLHNFHSSSYDGLPKEPKTKTIYEKKNQWSTSWWYQFKVLLRRGLKERRYESFNRLRIFQVISVATLGGLLWWHTPSSHIEDRTALLFFFSVFWSFYPLYNAVFTFPQERKMLIKERASGMYHLSSYFLARTIGDLPLELALPTTFVIILYWMGGLKADPFTFILSLIVVLYTVLVSQSLGLAIGAILMEIKQATTLASVVSLVFLIAGGYYVKQIPPFISWLKYISFSYYCYKLLLGMQYKEDELFECSPGKWCRVGDVPAINSMGLNNLWADVLAMAVMLVGYRLVAYFALIRVQKM